MDPAGGQLLGLVQGPISTVRAQVFLPTLPSLPRLLCPHACHVTLTSWPPQFQASSPCVTYQIKGEGVLCQQLLSLSSGKQNFPQKAHGSLPFIGYPSYYTLSAVKRLLGFFWLSDGGGREDGFAYGCQLINHRSATVLQHSLLPRTLVISWVIV